MISIRTKLSIGLSVAALATAFVIGLLTYRHTLNEGTVRLSVEADCLVAEGLRLDTAAGS
jgi:hypothetical protein